MSENYLGRKFVIVALFSVVACAALFMRLLTGAEFVTMAGLLVGSFTAGDVALNFIHRRNGHAENKP